MSSSTIGALRVDLGLSTAQFQAGAKKAQSTLGTLGASMKSFAIAATAALSFSAITTGFKSIVNHADELGKSAMKIGIPVEQLSRLAYAAKLSNVEFSTLSTGMNKFNKNLAAIAGGGGGDAAKALSALGISAVDATGKLRPTQEVFLDIAEKFKGMEDGAGKSALAMMLFGKSGAELIPVMNEGRAGITKLMGETSLFGQVINEKFAKDADQFNDNLDRIAGAGQHLATALTEELLKSLVGVSDQMVAIVENGGMEAFLKGLRTEATTAAKEFNKLAEAWTFLSEGSEGFRKMVADAKAKQPLTQEQKNASASALNFGFAKPITVFTPPKKDAPIIDTSTDKVDKLAEAYQRLADAGQNVWEDTRTPLEKYQLEIRKLNDLQDAGMIDHATYLRGVKQLQDGFAETGEAAKTLGQELAQTFGDNIKGWLDSAVDGTFKFKDALNDLMGQLTKLALNTAFQNLFAGTNPSQASNPLAGLGKLFGFASGGSFQVGGSGGIDSQLVAFKASPNERVSVTKPGQERGGATNVEVNVMNYGDSGVDVQKSQGPNGPRLNVIIGRMIDQHIASGQADPVMRGRYGARPQTKMR